MTFGILCLVLFFLIVALWVQKNGKSFIKSKAAQIFKVPVTVENVDFIFPVGMRLTGLDIPGLLFAPQADIQLGVIALFNGSLELNDVRLTGPVVTIHHGLDQHAPIETAGQKPGVVLTGDRQDVRAKVLIHRLSLHEGRFHFPGRDHDDPIDVYLKDVRLTARDVPLSGQDLDSAFDLSATIMGDGLPVSGDGITARGTVNWPRRDMDADVSMTGPDGNTDIEAKLNSRNNDLKVQGHMKTAQILKAPQKDQGTVADALLGAVDASGMGLDMQFSFATHMDRWELRNIDFSGNLSPSLKSNK